MGWTSAALFGALTALLGAYALHVYRRREVAAPGVGALAVLRILALALIVLLLLDPSLPAAATSLGGGGAWTLVDGSRSMAASAGPDRLWPDALRDAGARGGGPVLVFGDDDPRPLERVDPADRPPFASSRLVPALERAAESGARSVRVVSDLRLEDAARARQVADRLGLEVAVDPRPHPDVRSAGMDAFDIEGPLAADEPVTVRASYFVVGASAGDSLTLEVREEGRLVASRRLPVPGEGRLGRAELDLPPPESDGEVRYTARVGFEGDGFPDDDERVVWSDVSPEEGNLVLVTLEPDWELRFLMPVLQRVTGLPSRGFVRVGADRYLAMGSGGAEGTVERAAVEAMAAGAELLVVQAASAPPDWLAEALSAVRRTVVLARGPGAATAAGVGVGAPRPGEWYASAELLPSPLAGELASAELRGLPPLAGVLPLVADAPPGPVPLEVQLQGGAASEVAMVLVPDGGSGRRVVMLASGFWRWGFREGAGRDAYERLWSGVAGWLLADEPLARGPGIRPEERAVPWREPVWWTASGLVGADVAIRVSRRDGEASDTVPAPDTVPDLDTVLTVPEAGRFRLPPMDAGTYQWSAEVVRVGDSTGSAPAAGEAPGATPDPVEQEGGVVGAGGSGSQDGDAWNGRFDVELWTGDLRHPRDTVLLEAGEGEGEEGRPAGAAGPGRPLRTHPLPYLLILALLSAEWIGRRRKGMR